MIVEGNDLSSVPESGLLCWTCMTPGCEVVGHFTDEPGHCSICLEDLTGVYDTTFIVPTNRGRGDDDRGGPRASRPSTRVPCTQPESYEVGRAAGALLTGQCQDGPSQVPATRQYPGVVHGGAGPYLFCECGHPRSEHEPSVQHAFLYRNPGPFVCVHLFSDQPHEDGWPDVCMCTEFTPERVEGMEDEPA